jgi:ABC-type phosphate/phosphonate transport system substrate-binding protein
MTDIFGSLVKEETGVNARVSLAGDAFRLGRLLEDKKYQLGFFYGVEYAWAKEKYRDLQPLVIVISKYHAWHARLLVRKDSQASDLTSLRGKNLAMPQRYRPHCRLFMEKICARQGASQGDRQGANPQSFFGQITYPTSTEDALDSLVSGEVQAAIVDDFAVDNYRDLKPGCFARLKVVEESEAFPPGVIAYRARGVAGDVLDRLRKGLMNAKNSVRGRELMALFGVTDFEEVPSNLRQRLSEIVAAYPPPH